MKTLRINKLARVTGIAIAVALFASVAGVSKAEEPVFKGGAQKLMTPAPAPGPSDYKPMSCVKCKSEWVTRTENTSKGIIKPTALVERHFCNGCDTTIATVGHGKGKHDVAIHKCNSSGAVSVGCCSTKAGG